MLEKDFANMSIKELEEYCRETQKKLDEAKGLLLNRRLDQLNEANKSKNS